MRLLLVSLLACALTVPAFADPAPAGSVDAAHGQNALVVVLDPGHGGTWPNMGAKGPRGLWEKQVALAIALKTKVALEERGATVFLTRTEDVDVTLAQRAAIANEQNADVFVSIHANSMQESADRKLTKGIETYFLHPDPTDAEAKYLAELENGGPNAMPLPRTSDAVSGLLNDLALSQARNDSAAFAALVHRQLIRRTGAPSRGVRQAPFLVLAGTKMPSILCEVGFISHPGEGRQLGRDKYQQRIATAIADGVQEFADKVLVRRLFATGDRARVAAAKRPADGPKVAAAPEAGAPAVAPAGPLTEAPPSVNAAGVAPVAPPAATR